MRSTFLLGSLTALTLASAACSSGIEVRTAATPDAHLAGLRTFRILNAPQRRAGAPALSMSDPMLDNSITNRQLRADLLQGFEAKGYVVDSATSESAGPDFLVAYYAGTKQKMDTTYWNPDPWWRYGYPGYGRRGYRYGWAWPWYGSPFDAPWPDMQVREYTQGSVIVDVIDAKTKELLWRGQGTATVSKDPATYAKELDQTVGAILKKFPHA